MSQAALPTPDFADLALGMLLLTPVLVVILTATMVLILDLAWPEWVSRRPLAWVSAAGLAIAAVATVWLGSTAAVGQSAFGGFLAVDRFALFFYFLFLLAALLVILSLTSFADRQEQVEGEFYSITLYSTAGVMLLASATELISIYLSLELTSLSMAFLATWYKNERQAQQGLKSAEAGMKFFLLSAMSSALLLFGMALLYGMTGATTLREISQTLTQPAFMQTGAPTVLLAVSLVLAGFGFKIAAAPFHLWTPDVYQGAPTPATAYFSVASKAAGFAVILRVFSGVIPAISVEWPVIIGALALLTMTLGNLIAIVQTNVKRLMAYSSITHVGYMLLGVAAATTPAFSGVMFYLLAYAFTNLAAFIVITIMARYAPDDEVSGYAGLARRSPVLGLCLTAALLSLAGIPPFVGFFSKMYLFLAVIERGSSWLGFLVLWAVVMSAISLFYYGRVIHTMWMRDATEVEPVVTAPSQGLALAASVVGVLLLGILAGPFLAAALVAAQSIAR